MKGSPRERARTARGGEPDAARQVAEHHRITWRDIVLTITFQPNRFGLSDHIELRTDSGTTLPVTETGYRSHFVATGAVDAHGGAVAFVTAWLDFEAKRTGWGGAQLSLF